MSDGTPGESSNIDEFYFEGDRQEKFRNRSPLIVCVKIYDGELLIRDHSRNIRNRKNLEWLVNAIVWASHNDKRIEIERKIQ